MSRNGPVVTLLGGGAIAVALFVASANAAGPTGDDPVLAGGQATPTEEPPAPESTDPPEDEDEVADDDAEDADVDEVVEDEDQPSITYVGYVNGGGVSVAILVDGDEVTAYVCNGSDIESWLRGEISDGQVDLTNDDGDVLTATVDEEEARGSTTVGDRAFTFALEGVAAPEGLYRFADTIVGGAEVDGGWIILPDGTQIGVLNVDGVPQPAPALDPVTGAVTVEGYKFIADRQG